jgi:hypothetical protein
LGIGVFGTSWYGLGFELSGFTTFTTTLYILPRRDVLGDIWGLGMGIAWSGILAFLVKVQMLLCLLFAWEGRSTNDGVYSTMDCLLMDTT